ncbi:MAG: adenosylmethionine decarboxylase [Lautropia sp.]
MQGLHLTADLYGCGCEPALLISPQRLTGLLRTEVAAAELAVVGEAVHRFEQAGVTAVLLLAESHLSVHTWPELGAVTLDVYVCNFGADNSIKAERLIERLTAAFAAAEPVIRRLQRGR